MAATVTDLTVAYRIMSQPKPEDAVQGLFAVSQPPGPTAKRTIGICHEWVARSDPVVTELFRKTIDYFEAKLGYEVIDIKLPYLREGQIAHAGICLTEGLSDARARVKNPDEYLKLISYPNRVLLSTAQDTPALDWLRYGQIRQVIMQHLAWLWERHPGLVIASPTQPFAGWKMHPGDAAYGLSDANTTLRSMMYLWLANMAGTPAVQCPMGYAEPEQGQGKLPVGLMAMGEWGAEEQLLGFARDAETYLDDVYPGGRLRPEEWADVLAMAEEQGPIDELEPAASQAT